MRAFLIAQQTWRNGGDSFDDVCPALLSVAGHPFVELQIRSLISIGVKEVRISGGFYTSQIEKVLGDGSRWGIKISYAICPEGKPWNEILILNRSFAAGAEELLLIRGNVLFPANIHIGGKSAILYSVSLENFLNSLSRNSGALFLPLSEVDAVLKVGFPREVIENIHTYIADTHDSMLKINKMILGGEDKWDDPDFPKAFNRVFIASTAKVSAGTELSSACVIGEKCRIEKGVKIGGNVSIGEGGIIDRGAIIHNSIIDRNTYIGKFASVESSIISGHRIYSQKNDSCTYVPDNFWVDSLNQKDDFFNEKVSWGERLMAMFYWLIYWWILRSKGCLRKEYRAVLGVAEQDDLDGHFRMGEMVYKMDKTLPPFYAVISALPEVIKGKMHLCGRVPLAPEQKNLIPPDFMKIYLAASPGIVSIEDNLLCANSFQRKVQDIYLCGRIGFIKRFQLFLESCRTLQHSNIASGYLMEAGLKKEEKKGAKDE